MKHCHESCAADWPYSSIHQYIKAGMTGHDWGGDICKIDKSDKKAMARQNDAVGVRFSPQPTGLP